MVGHVGPAASDIWYPWHPSRPHLPGSMLGQQPFFNMRSLAAWHIVGIVLSEDRAPQDWMNIQTENHLVRTINAFLARTIAPRFRTSLWSNGSVRALVEVEAEAEATACAFMDAVARLAWFLRHHTAPINYTYLISLSQKVAQCLML